MKKPLAFVGVLAALLLAVYGCAGDFEEEVEATETASGEPTPAPDFTLTSADGKQVSLSDYKDQVVLLNFWATWCVPCKIEMPWFVEFQREYKDKGFTVLAVSLDEEGWEVVRPFLEEMKPNFPVLLGDDETAERFGGVVALPTTVIVSRQGEIVSRHTGLVSKSEYVEDIEKLL